MSQAHARVSLRKGEQPASSSAVAIDLAQPGAGPADAVIHVTYYTDPLCSWSWAFEPQWRRLRYEYGDQLAWTYRMGGMIPNWDQYADPLNDVSRPVQMGPQWFQVRAISGMPLNEAIWHKDPPASSYPACIAVKAAQQQGAEAGEQYLRRVREAVMVEEQNIVHQEVLWACGHDVAACCPSFSLARFEASLEQGSALQDFRTDMQDVRYRAIGRFPTLLLHHRSGGSVMLVGYRPYDALREVIRRLAPEMAVQRPADEIVPFVSCWGRVTLQEVAEACAMDRPAARSALERLVAKGELIERGPFYVACTGR
jgi:predicted DsbA family dithiol-disulfide isomerase